MQDFKPTEQSGLELVGRMDSQAISCPNPTSNACDWMGLRRPYGITDQQRRGLHDKDIPFRTKRVRRRLEMVSPKRRDVLVECHTKGTATDDINFIKGVKNVRKS